MKLIAVTLSLVASCLACGCEAIDWCQAGQCNYENATKCPQPVYSIDRCCCATNFPKAIACAGGCAKTHFDSQFNYTGKCNLCGSYGQCPTDTAGYGCGCGATCGNQKLGNTTACCGKGPKKCPLGSPCNMEVWNYDACGNGTINPAFREWLCGNTNTTRKLQTLCPCPYDDLCNPVCRLDCGNGPCPTAATCTTTCSSQDNTSNTSTTSCACPTICGVTPCRCPAYNAEVGSGGCAALQCRDCGCNTGCCPAKDTCCKYKDAFCGGCPLQVCPTISTVTPGRCPAIGSCHPKCPEVLCAGTAGAKYANCGCCPGSTEETTDAGETGFSKGTGSVAKERVWTLTIELTDINPADLNYSAFPTAEDLKGDFGLNTASAFTFDVSLDACPSARRQRRRLLAEEKSCITVSSTVSYKGANATDASAEMTLRETAFKAFMEDDANDDVDEGIKVVGVAFADVAAEETNAPSPANTNALEFSGAMGSFVASAAALGATVAVLLA